MLSLDELDIPCYQESLREDLRFVPGVCPGLTSDALYLLRHSASSKPNTLFRLAGV